MRELDADSPEAARHYRRKDEMTREEAFARCPSDSYVEFYGNRWLIIPIEPVAQPHFFVCTPGA
jgi:hypothetical protein